MKRQSVILIIYLGVLMSTIFIHLPYSNSIVLGLTIIFLGYLVFEFINIATKKLEGDRILRRQMKRVRPIFIILALITTVGFFINGRINFIQILLFWLIVVYDIAICLITRRLKPIGIVIKGNYLLLNDFRNTKRNLGQLKGLQLNGYSDEIEMTFLKERSLYIKRIEYLGLDIESLISICIERSQEQVSISNNLKNENSRR